MQSKTVAGGLLLGVALTAGTWALAQKNAPLLVRIVHISFLVHQAQMRHAADPPATWSKALLNAPVVEGESIRTSPQSEIEVQLECGSALRLAPDSEFSFPQLSLRPDGVAVTTVAVETGSAFFSMRHQDSRDFQVIVPADRHATVIPAKSADFRVDVPAHAPASVQLTGGHADVRVGGAAFKLKKSMRLVWSADVAPHLDWAPPPDAAARWNRSREDAFGRALLASQPISQFAGAELAAAPGSNSVTQGTPQANWNSDGFLNAPTGFHVNGYTQWEAIADQPTGLPKSSVQVPACARY